MTYKEFGKEKKETVLLLHGGGLSWWNYREAAEQLKEEYHVILPVLDGHAGSGYPFTSIEDNARRIIAFIDGKLGGHVSLIGGLSLGGQVLLEMLSQKKDICENAIAESAAVIPSPVTRAMIAPSLAASYGLVKNRAFAKAQFRSLHMKRELFEEYYRDTCLITRQDMTSFLKASAGYALNDQIKKTEANMYIFCGEKENARVRRSAQMIRDAVPGSRFQVLPGLRHGEFSINHPAQYADTVRKILNDSRG